MAVFELRGLGDALAPTVLDLSVGPWTSAPAGLPVFDAPGAGGAGDARPSGPVWRVDLGRDPTANRADLAAGERSVAQTHAALDDLPRRFDRALAELRRADLAAIATPAPAPESELFAALARPVVGPAHAAARAASTFTSDLAPGSAAQQPGRLAGPAAGSANAAALAASIIAPGPANAAALAASIITPGIAPGSAAQQPGRLERALDHIADLTRGRARIETHLGGALVAHSVMTLSGDTELWLAPRLSLAGAQLHARSVAVAARTRVAWARILTLVLRGTGQILVLGVPAGSAAALPMVWRFIRGVLREDRQARAAAAAT